MMPPLDIDPVEAVLWIPLVAAALLALLPGYRIAAGVNVVACFLSLVLAASAA